MKIRDPKQQASLSKAVLKGDLKEIKALCDAGAQVDSRDYEGTTALMIALERGNVDAAKVLLAAGANPNLKTIFGETALTLAVQNGELDAVRFLLGIKDIHGIDINHQSYGFNTQFDKTILMHAIERLPPTIPAAPGSITSSAVNSEMQNRIKIIELLLTAGADPSLLNESNNNAWIVAKQVKAPKEVLEKLNATIGLTTEGEELHQAIKNHDLEAVKKLLQQKDRVPNLVNQPEPRSGNSPLMTAINVGNTRIIKLLLENGANINQPNRLGNTPYNNSIDSPHIRKLLEKFGVPIKESEVLIREQAKNVTRANHLLGLEARTTVEWLEAGKNIFTESGATLGDSLTTMTEILSAYISSLDTDPKLKMDFTEINEAMNVCLEFVLKEGTGDTKKLTERLNNQKITISPTGWKEHFLALAWLQFPSFLDPSKNTLYMMKSNRGDGLDDDESGTLIYEIESSNQPNINSEYLSSLSEFLNETMTKDEIQPRIHRYVDRNNPVVSLPTKPQGHGTCGLVNYKSLCILLLYSLKILYLNQALKSNDTNLLAEAEKNFGFPIKTLEDVKKASEQYAIREYKKFTTFIRDYEINRLINLYKKSTKVSADRAFYRSILTDYLLQHHGQIKKYSKKRPGKIAEELKRAQWILESLTEIDQSLVLEKLENSGIMLLCAAAKQGNAKLVALLVKAGVSIHRTNDLNQTPLAAALENGDAETIKILVSANMKTVPLFFTTALHFGEVAVLNLLSKDAMVSKWLAEPLNYQFALKEAIQNNQVKSLEFLLGVFKGSTEQRKELIFKACETAYNDSKIDALKYLLSTSEGQEYLNHNTDPSNTNARVFITTLIDYAIRNTDPNWLNTVVHLSSKDLHEEFEIAAFNKAVEFWNLRILQQTLEFKSVIAYLNNPANLNKYQPILEKLVGKNNAEFIHAVLLVISNSQTKDYLEITLFQLAQQAESYDVISNLISSKSISEYLNDPYNDEDIEDLIANLIFNKNLLLLETILHNITDDERRTEYTEFALTTALEKNNPTIAAGLIDKISNASFYDPLNENNISHFIRGIAASASEEEKKDISNIELLLEHCEDINMRNRLAMVAFEAGIKNKMSKLITLTVAYKSVSEFLSNASNQDQITAMIEDMMKHRNYFIIYKILRACASPDLQKDLLIFTFKTGCQEGDPDIINFILSEFKPMVEWLNSQASNIIPYLENAIKTENELLIAALLVHCTDSKIQKEVCVALAPTITTTNNSKLLEALMSQPFIKSYFQENLEFKTNLDKMQLSTTQKIFSPAFKKQLDLASSTKNETKDDVETKSKISNQTQSQVNNKPPSLP